MNCNIAQQGKIARIIAGGVLESSGWLLLVLRFVDILQSDWPLWVGGALVAIGLAIIMMGIAGWCALRALGLETPI